MTFLAELADVVINGRKPQAPVMAPGKLHPQTIERLVLRRVSVVKWDGKLYRVTVEPVAQ